MPGRCAIRWLLLALAPAALLAWASQLPGQELARLDARTPNNSKDVLLAADAVSVADEGGWRYFRLLGGVRVEQSVARVWARRAIVRVDLDRFRREGVYDLAVYTEGEVALENGSTSQRGERGVAVLETRGILNFGGGKALPQSLADDPFFARAKEALPQASPIVQTTALAQPAGPPPTDQVPAPGLPPTLPPVGAAPMLPVLPSTPPAQQPVAVAAAPPRQLHIGPRYGRQFEIDSDPTQKSIILTGGVILSISNVEKLGLVDIEADNVVIWTKGDSQQFFQNLQGPQGQTSRESEFFLSGNVVIRAAMENQERVLRADQVYYDVSRNVAVGVSADVEFREKGVPEAIHFRSDEVFQIGPNAFRAARAEMFSSRLPSDPGLKVYLREATITQQEVPRTNVFGIPFRDRVTGLPQTTTERILHGENVFFELADVPVFYLPRLNGNSETLAGPLKVIDFRHDGIFGYQIYSEFDVYNLLGRNPPPGASWTVIADYLTRRGPAFGTNYGYGGDSLFGLPGHYYGHFKFWGIYDHAVDLIGAFRGAEVHPLFRDRVSWRHMQDLPDGWQFMGQVSYLSDKNFLEQYYKPEFDQEANQETFAYVTKRYGNFGGSLLAEPRIRSWVTETAWLPKAEARVLGWSFFDRLTYDAKASAGYAQLRPTDVPPPPLNITDARTNVGRFDLYQDLALPFHLGPIKLAPFGVVDLTEYTNDLTGNSRGRVYGGGGIRASLPLSRLYPNVESDLFNLNGLYHKSVLSSTYFAAWSDTPYTRLPQLDRLNNDATDQALRDITPLQPFFNPVNGLTLATSPLYNPQVYAIRRLVDERTDTLDTIQELQLDWRNRWQTKRGFPGMQHTVDWLTIDTSVALFPSRTRDNFGSNVGFLEYDVIWNVGDRTALGANGWVDPFINGAKYFAVGANLNRTDRTSFNVGFRYTDPINSRVVSAGANYVFSPKYALSAGSSYDFGMNRGLSNALTFTRSGTDLQLNISVTYNPLLNNFGFSVEILPLIAAAQRLAVGPTDPNNVRGR